jgi:uncharacterized protein (TIGR02421 family)
MLTLSEAGVIALIEQEKTFECRLDDGSLTLKIEEYVPFLCTAIHQGHRLRSELVSSCQLSAKERRHEEDPYTADLISSMPVTLVAEDSRYEYDLNRPLSQCIYQKAWGKKVWKKRLTDAQISRSHDKHRCFYRILDALIGKLQEKFKGCIVFDVHAYNYQRLAGGAPTFNLGTEQIDMERWGSVVKRFQKLLGQMQLPNIRVVAALNEVFYGRGYLIGHINGKFENTLVLPTEVKKVFMDEMSGELFPLVLDEMKDGTKRAIAETAAFFARRHTRKTRARHQDMLSTTLEPAIVEVDSQLYRLAKGVETLQYINPINIPHEKKHFFAQNGNYRPAFTYRQLNIDPYQFREKLYRLPVDDIRDVGIQQMYRQVVNTFADKIDMLVSIGSEQFIYNSLRYYGEPSEKDLANARFLLYASPLAEEDEAQDIRPDEMVAYFQDIARQWKLDCRIETSSRLVAAAMVNNARRTLLIRRDARVSRTELQALAHHELGVHMVTTLNALRQPLKVFSLGLPSNTVAQEGLAILCEYLSGNMTLGRLKELALRVIAVDQMIRTGDFRQTFYMLTEEHRLDRNSAFRLATRVHRGGGFTKDYLYLRGLHNALGIYQEEDITGLFIGKTGFANLPLINELMARGILEKPVYMPECLDNIRPSSEVLGYLVASIR